MLLTALCLVGVNGRAQSNAFHTMTFINEGGGYFSFSRSTPDGQSVDTMDYTFRRSSTETLQVQEGSSVYIGLSSERRGSFFYGEIRYEGGFPRLLHFYVDNREVPLDSIYSFYDEEGFYYWYSYTLANITSDHTFRAVFGEWEEDMPPRPTHTVAFIESHNLSCGFEHSSGSWTSGTAIGENRGDTLFVTVEEGMHFSVGFGGVRPEGSPSYNRDPERRPLHLYVDDVEIPLDSLSRRFDCATLEYGYSYRQVVTSDHEVRVVFGPVDTTQLPPLHTIGVVNEGGGYIDYGELSSHIDYNMLYFLPDTIPFQAEEGMDVDILMSSLMPGHWWFEEYPSRVVNPRLLHFYVNGVEVPLDSIYVGYYNDEYFYKYTLPNISSSHTVRAVFGQWDTDTLPSLHNMTIQNHGGGKIHSPRFKVRNSIRMLQVLEGDPFTVKMDSYRPGSPHYGDYANPKLLHFYVDDVEVPLGSIFSGYDAATQTLHYVYTDSNVTANHVFRAEFGPWSDDVYVLTLEANDPAMGSVFGGGTYEAGTEATLTATPNEGYRFVGWQDGNADNPRTVTVTADATYIATFEAEVGIDEVEGTDDIVLYPNPASGQVSLRDVEPGTVVTVVDMQGRIHSKISTQKSEITLDVSQWPAGAYFVRIAGERQTAVRRLLVR